MLPHAADIPRRTPKTRNALRLIPRPPDIRDCRASNTASSRGQCDPYPNALVGSVPRAAVVEAAVRLGDVPLSLHARPRPGRNLVLRPLGPRPTHGPRCAHGESGRLMKGTDLDRDELDRPSAGDPGRRAAFRPCCIPFGTSGEDIKERPWFPLEAPKQRSPFCSQH